MPVDIPTLVDLVVARARVDTSAPDSVNLRNGWRTDALLTGDIDALVVGKNNDPATYAEIGQLVYAQVTDLPEMATLAELAILRGARLIAPADPVREQSILQLSDMLKRHISALPDGTRKMRCASLLEYHMGIFYETYGRFDLAAAAQIRSAEEAERLGDRAGTAIAYYSAARDNLKEALRTDKPADELKALFSEQETRFAELVEAVRDTPHEVQWTQGNCPMHMVEACVWLNRTHPRWDEWVATAVAAPVKLGAAWMPGADFVLAADMDHRDDPGAEDTLYTIARDNNVNERKATANLILARRALRAGARGAAQILVMLMPTEGTQHVRAIAERLLA